MDPNHSSPPPQNSYDQLCLLIGNLTGKVEALVDALALNAKDLSTERGRIDAIDKKLAGIAVIGPIMTVLIPSMIGVATTLMMREPVDRGLTNSEVMELRRELEELRRFQRYTGEPETFIPPERYRLFDEERRRRAAEDSKSP